MKTYAWCACLALLAPAAAQASGEILLNRGDDGRLEAVFARAERGETVTLGALGGSITQGTGAGSNANRWTDLVADWFVANFPNARFVRANAGLGSTGSLIGAHRIATELAPSNPDFVTVDFSVNDGDNDPNVASMDSCARQLLSLPKSPAVILVSFMTKTGRSVQDDHLVVAKHYDLAHLSVKNAVWPDIEAGQRTWEAWSADDVHPNREGHAFAASLVTGFLAERLADWRARGCPAPGPAGALPAPISTTFANGRMVAPTQLTVLENTGFAADGTVRKGWSGVMAATSPGARLTFETTAPTVTLLHWKVHGDYGRALATVDGVPLTVLEGWYSETWGGYVPVTIAFADKPGRHVVSLEVQHEKNAASNGYRFELCKVLMAGEDRSAGGVADTFESYRTGTDIAYLPGWTGAGEVVEEAPQVPDPPGYPVPDAGHERVLESPFGAKRHLPPFGDGRERVCDFLVKVQRQTEADWKDEMPSADESRLAVSFDRDGVLCLLSEDDVGRRQWRRIDETRTYGDGEWVRVACRFRSRAVDGMLWCQVSVNGQVCSAGEDSWFRLSGSGDGGPMVSEVGFDRNAWVDDFTVKDRSSGGLTVLFR